MLGDILDATLSAEPDLTVSRQADYDFTAVATGHSRPVAILARSGAVPDEQIAKFLLRSACACVISIAADGKGGVLHTLGPRVEILGEITSAALLAAIRESVDISA
jgi:hypothetical protein